MSTPKATEHRAAESADRTALAPTDRPGAARHSGSECVLVLGCPRSGTSVLAWAIAQNREFWTSAESDFLIHLFGRGQLHTSFKKAYERPDGGWLAKNRVSFGEFAGHIGIGVDQLFQSRSKGRRWIDATPGHTLMAEELRHLFPNGRFVNIVRDGRAVVNSMIRSGFETDWSGDFKVACKTWEHYVSRGRRFEDRLRDRALGIRYERMIEDPVAVFREIYDFLGAEPGAEAAAEFIRTKRVNSSYGNKTMEDVKAVKDPSLLPKEPWREWSSSMIRTFESIAGSLMDELGFKRDW